MVYILRVLCVLTATVAAALGFAVPASADESGYLAMLQDRLTFLTAQQLLPEGHKVCAAINGGMGSSNAVVMVQKDLAVGVPDADDIVEAAVLNFGC